MALMWSKIQAGNNTQSLLFFVQTLLSLGIRLSANMMTGQLSIHDKLLHACTHKLNFWYSCTFAVP